MPDRNPLPPCLSHLAQRDAAVWVRAIEAAVVVVKGETLNDETSTSEDLAYNTAICYCVDAILALKDKPNA